MTKKQPKDQDFEKRVLRRRETRDSSLENHNHNCGGFIGWTCCDLMLLMTCVFRMDRAMSPCSVKPALKTNPATRLLNGRIHVWHDWSATVQRWCGL